MNGGGSLGELTDEQLLARLVGLMRQSNAITAEVLAHIAEVDARKAYRQQACGSMFTYCVERLGMSEGAAYRRIRVARVARELPVVLRAVAEGRVHLSGLTVLAPLLTKENCAAMLERAEGKSKREIEELAASLAPKPDVSSRVRALPRRQGRVEKERAGSPGTLFDVGDSVREEAKSNNAVPDHRPAPPPRPVAAPVTPLAPARYKVEFMADAALRQKIETASKLLRGQVPGGELAPIVDRALDLLIDKLMNERFGVTARPQKPRAGKVGSRHVPRAVRRAVIARDGRRCTFVDGEGRRCSEQSFLELDHAVPFAQGGQATVENIRLRCRAHNALAAEEAFGRAFVERRIAARRA